MIDEEWIELLRNAGSEGFLLTEPQAEEIADLLAVPKGKSMNGDMIYKLKRIAVVNVIAAERESRTGWWASDAELVNSGISLRDSQMFYPEDMFTFEAVSRA